MVWEENQDNNNTPVDLEASLVTENNNISPVLQLIDPESGIIFSVQSAIDASKLLNRLYCFEIDSVKTNAVPGFDTLMTLEVPAFTLPNYNIEPLSLEISTMVTVEAGSDANVNVRLLLDGTPLQNAGGGANMFMPLSDNKMTVNVTKLISLDPNIPHTVTVEWESPSSTLLTIDPDTGGASVKAKYVFSTWSNGV
jgi:hypothetical protein